MSPYSVNIKFVHSKVAQKIVKHLGGFIEENNIKELKKQKDIIIGVNWVYKLLKTIDPKISPSGYYVFALKYAEIAEMLKNLPIVCKIKKQLFYYLPKFIGEKTSKIFGVKVNIIH